MNAVITFTNQIVNVVDPHVSGICQFLRAPGQKPAGGNTENDCLENRLILFIEPTVDEYASVGGRWHSTLAVFDDQMNLFTAARLDSRSVRRRMIFPQVRHSSHCFSYHALRHSAVPPNLTNWTIFSRGHTEIYRTNGLLSSIFRTARHANVIAFKIDDHLRSTPASAPRRGKHLRLLCIESLNCSKNSSYFCCPCSAENRNGYTFLTQTCMSAAPAKHSAAQVVIPTHRPCRGSQPLHSLASGWLFKIDMTSSMNSSSGATSAFDDFSQSRYEKLWPISVVRLVVSFLFRIPILCLNAHGIWYLVAGR